jgi:hypothetical protein
MSAHGTKQRAEQTYAKLEAALMTEDVNAHLVAQGHPPMAPSSGGCCASMTPEQVAINHRASLLVGNPLEFEFSLHQVQAVDAFQREPWEMGLGERWQEAQEQRTRGQEAYHAGQVDGACARYQRALVLLESMVTHPTIVEAKRNKDTAMDIPVGAGGASQTTKLDIAQMDALMQACRGNYAACKLKQGDYTTVVIQCTEVLTHDPHNIKALFRRAQAHTRKGRDLEEAEADLTALRSLLCPAKPSPAQAVMWGEVQREWQVLKQTQRKHAAKEARMFGNIFAS